jgi:hypothetical protein
MSDDELERRVETIFRDWIDLNFHKKYDFASTFTSQSWKDWHAEAIREFGIEWDRTLNALGIRRIEHHLNIPPRKGYIRIIDPFIHGPNYRRDLELTMHQATKILTLGIP